MKMFFFTAVSQYVAQRSSALRPLWSNKPKLSCYHETKLMQNKLYIKPKPTMA